MFVKSESVEYIDNKGSARQPTPYHMYVNYFTIR